ncbi:hypothetical protein PSCICO_27360 [Pseudomonas cichorii]|nr:hypothetical protein PSCICO_27360 [Pseudomonas cichorii]
MKTTQRVLRVDGVQQVDLLTGLGILSPGNELGMQHFTFAQLIGHGHTRVSEHIAKTFQTLGECCWGQFKEEVSGAFASAGIDLPAMALHECHEVLIGSESLGAQKKQMLQKVRQPRPRLGNIMATGRNPKRRRTTLEPWRMTQHHVQAIGQHKSLDIRHDRFHRKQVVMLTVH